VNNARAISARSWLPYSLRPLADGAVKQRVADQMEIGRFGLLRRRRVRRYERRRWRRRGNGAVGQAGEQGAMHRGRVRMVRVARQPGGEVRGRSLLVRTAQIAVCQDMAVQRGIRQRRGQRRGFSHRTLGLQRENLADFLGNARGQGFRQRRPSAAAGVQRADPRHRHRRIVASRRTLRVSRRH
jgi:hypothetical protein